MRNDLVNQDRASLLKSAEVITTANRETAAMKLNLIRVDASQERGAFSLFLFRGKLELRGPSRNEILKQTSGVNDLIHRHGLKRVAAFYEDTVLPALRQLPKCPENWRAQYEVCCQFLQMLVQSRPPVKAVRLVREMLRDLPHAGFTDDPKKDVAVRQQVRAFLSAQVTRLAEQLRADGYINDALSAYELLDQLQGLNRRQRAEYAALLWASRDTRPAALNIYLRYLSDCRWDLTAGASAREMAEFVEAHLSIDETIQGDELRDRLLMNQVACCGPHAPAFSLRNIGLGYLQLKDSNRALPYLKRALASDNNHNGATAFHLGQALFKAQDFDHAASAFEQAVAQGFNESRIAAWKGLACAQAGRNEEALDSFHAAETTWREKLDGQFYVLWGRASFLMGNVEDAEQRFRLAMQRDPKDWRATYGLAICLERQGQPQAAIATLQQVADSGSVASPLYKLGRLLQTEKPQEAIAYYRRAVALNPDEIEYSLALALTSAERADVETLATLTRAAHHGLGGLEVMRRLALGAVSNRDYERALYWLGALVDARPPTPAVARYHARALAHQATVSFNAGDFRQATRIWTQVAEMDANGAQVNDRLTLALVSQIRTQLRAGELDDLSEQLESVDRLAMNDEVRFLRGVADLVRGDFQLAQQRFSSLAGTPFDRSEASPFRELAALLAIGDERLGGCLRTGGEESDSTTHLLAGIYAGLLRLAHQQLSPPAVARLEDDLPWPPPPEAFEPTFEPLEKAIQRER